MAESDDTVPVKTYVDPKDKARWQEDAEELGMSQAEFVRSMVQAGRQDFDLDAVADPSTAPDPGGETFEDRIADAIRAEGGLTSEELTALVEGWLDDALDSLQRRNLITHHREDGYVVDEP